ncbi:MAG: ribonuclease HI [Deltaproteobacteria bacterium]|nr:MAG: ribonuclease HI [Deltaproteobacteria bacterium]
MSEARNTAHRTLQLVEIFADGACSGNPGPGGWGTILRSGRHEKELSGFAAETTNNRMELTAAIAGLSALKHPCRVRLTTDSEYLKKGMTEWVAGWVRRGWKNAKKEPVANRDLWEQLLELSSRHQVEWHWVRGHAGHAENERCDALARAAIADGRSK